MRHPILKDRNRIFIYIFLWILVAVFQYIFIEDAFEGYSLRILLTCLLQNFILGAMYLGAWFGLRYINLDTQKTYQYILNHTIYLIVITILWISVSNLLDVVLLRDVILEYRIRTVPLKSILGILSYLLFISFMYLDAYYVSFMEKMQNERRLNEILKEAELNLLKSQMNPHFIFNSLNSISSLTMLDPEKAQEMIIRLSDFLRYTVTASKQQIVTLDKEMDMCKAYLDIEKIRFGNKVEFSFDEEPQTLKMSVPAMILQTLFENAIKHGVYNSLNKECIHFSSRVQHDRLLLTIENSFDAEAAPKIGTGTGLINVKNRLDLIYDKNGILETSLEDNRFIARLNLPAL
jgi:two-component system LytT family sensor kinase